MTRAEKILASRLLEVAAREFHEHSCNDMQPEMFEGMLPGEVAWLVERFNEWWAKENPETDGDFELIHIRDDWWMEYLAHRIGEG
jgi:hypothetical protein